MKKKKDNSHAILFKAICHFVKEIKGKHVQTYIKETQSRKHENVVMLRPRNATEEHNGFYLTFTVNILFTGKQTKGKIQ